MADQHVDQVLTAAGVSAEVLAELKALPADAADFTTDKYIAPVSLAFQTRLENDPEFLKKVNTLEKLPAEVKKSIESGQYGRFMNETKEVLKAKGFTDDEIKDMEKLGLKGFLNAGLDGYSKKSGAPEALTKVQQDLADALRQKTDLTANQQKLIDDAVNGEKSKSDLRFERWATTNEINALEGAKIGDKVLKFAVAPSLVSGPIHEGVKAQYAVILNPETERFELKQKAHPELDALGSDGKKITYQQAAVAVAKNLNLVTEVAAEKVPAGKKVVKVDGDGTETASTGGIDAHIRKAAGLPAE